MENESVDKPGSESQDSQEPGKTEKLTYSIPLISSPNASTSQGFKLKPSSKGVKQAKKKLRAFSIQKKSAITPVVAGKPGTPNKPAVSGGTTTVLIGKLSGVKVTPKPDDADQKKPPRPPKPGQNKKTLQDLPYTVLRKRTLSDIEEMKRKMELIELGIPLGLICPTATSETAMPTKAMPPIKSFLNPAKLDEIISEAKKAKAEGKEFKFDYQKLLPDYDNPFQRKKDDVDSLKHMELDKDYHKKLDVDKKRSERYDRDSRRHSSLRRDEKDKWKDDRGKHREKSKDKHPKRDSKVSVERETDVNLSDYLVCDSWSLDNEDKTSSSSPKRQDISQCIDKKPVTVIEKPNESTEAKLLRKEIFKEISADSPKVKIEKLQPVIDSFKYELDSNDDEIIDLYDDNNDAEVTNKKDDFDSTFEKLFESDQFAKDGSNDALTDDTFLEAVINEIKQESISDDEGSNDKGLVEYDSPSRESYSPKDERISVTPELDDRMRDLQSRRSDYSDGYRSTESGYKSTESGYKSSGSYKSESRSDSYRMSAEKDLTSQMPKSTVDSLETWSFVLKICQPLLFRHDRNKCYRESRALPKIWYTVNPKMCSCVKDRAIVYEELETCKMNLVDKVYGCDQIQESEFPKVRAWYPRLARFLSETNTIPPVATSTDWEAEDSQSETIPVKDKGNTYKTIRSTTPMKSEEISLDREYQRFMEAVWPDVADSKAGTPRSTTPVKQEVRKKKVEDTQQEEKKKTKKIKLSSEGWSQESEVEEEPEKVKKLSKMDKVKIRKRKHSSSSVTDSDRDSKKRRKANKKKANKKSKAKLFKRRRLTKKYLKKLKEKHKKKKKQDSEDEDMEKENRKREKKLKKKKMQKKKKALKKKKAKAKSSSSSSSSTESSSDSSSDYESDNHQRKKKKRKSDVKKKRQQSSSESSQSEEDLFDENILNNIKTERLTDDENKLDFSRHKPREIINVKELQSDFVGSVKIKQEVEEKTIIKNKDIAQDKMTGKDKEVVEDKMIVINKELVEEKGIDKDKNIVKDKEVVEDKVVNKDEIVEVQKAEQLHKVTQKDEKEFRMKSEMEFSNSENVSQSVSESVPNSATEHFAKIALENIPVPMDACQFKEPLNHSIPQKHPEPVLADAAQPEESNLSLCSSQESSISKDPYEKDDSHLRPSSQNSNYSFNDVINASQSYQKEEEDKFEPDNYEGNYEMYEQLAMAYQSDVAKGNVSSSPRSGAEWWVSQRIETVVDGRVRGEIKCDWRAGDTPALTTHHRPSRWGLKPGEVNIVLTGGNTDQYPIHNVVEPVYQIETLANNRADNTSTGSYDEAYEDMYGASDRLQYGDCFATPKPEVVTIPPALTVPPLTTIKPLTTSSAFEDRIDQALKNTVLGEVAKVTEEADAEKDTPEKGILITNPESRSSKRVSFADGYKPGQDSDVEEPPRRKKKTRRYGCAWPCPATHPDHVPLWDALPPPPPPPGSPPPCISQQLPKMAQQPLLLQQPPPMLQQQRPPLLQQPPPMMQQQPPSMLQQGRPQLLQQSPASLLQQPPPMLQQQPPPMLQQQPPPMLQQQQPPMLQQQPPSMLQQQPPSMLQQQPPPMMPQQPPPMMPQPPPMLQQQPPPMLQQQPPPMLQQQQLMQQQLLKSLNPAILQGSPFAMGPKVDPSVSMSNFMPPEPPPGLISFQ